MVYVAYLYFIIRQLFLEYSRNVFEKNKSKNIRCQDGFLKGLDCNFICMDRSRSEGYYGYVAGFSNNIFEPFSRFCVFKTEDGRELSSGDVFKFDSYKEGTLRFIVGTQHESDTLILHFRCEVTFDFYRIDSLQFLSESGLKLPMVEGAYINSAEVKDYLKFLDFEHNFKFKSTDSWTNATRLHKTRQASTVDEGRIEKNLFQIEQARVAALLQTNSVLNKNIETLQNKLSKSNNNLSEFNILKTKNDNLLKGKDKLDDRIVQLLESHEKMKISKTSLKEKLDTMLNEKRAEKQKFSALKQDLSESNKKRSRLEQELNCAEEIYGKLTEDANSFQEATIKLTADLNISQRKVHKLTSDLNASKGTVVHLETEVNQLKKDQAVALTISSEQLRSNERNEQLRSKELNERNEQIKVLSEAGTIFEEKMKKMEQKFVETTNKHSENFQAKLEEKNVEISDNKVEAARQTVEKEAAKEEAARVRVEWTLKWSECNDAKIVVEEELKETKKRLRIAEDEQPNKITTEEMSRLQQENAQHKFEKDWYMKQCENLEKNNNLLLQHFLHPPPLPFYQDVNYSRYQGQMNASNSQTDASMESPAGIPAQSVSIFGSGAPSPMAYFLNANAPGNTILQQQQLRQLSSSKKS